MRKIFLFTIGLVTIILTTGQVMAQSSNQPSTSCEDSLYENEFSCNRLEAGSYCNFSAKLGRSDVEYNLYEEVYCNLTEDSDDDIFEVLVKQFKVEDPKIDEDKIEEILKNPKIETDPTGQTISDLHNRVRVAYHNEKVTHQTKESLKQQFKFAEMWADGTLTNSPFDLIVDLNLIEIIMFGSQAVWKDNVYTWPKDSSGDDLGADGGAAKGQTPTGPASDAGGQPPDDPSKKDDPIDQYECEPVDKGKELVENGILPKPGDTPKGCGDGKKEGAEECDDGNVRAGDGCSESCKSEEATSLSCKDNDAVTLKQFVPKKDSSKTPGAGSGSSGKDPGNNNAPPINCPPGSKAVKRTADKDIKLQQDPNYPGPFVGGVLKNFPKSNKGQCPPGSKYTEVSLFGESAGTCIPHEFCTPDFEKLRKKLFGADYRKDPAKKKAAEAIEASVCVEFKKVNRPESPYPVVEGCIDCHIQAMNDVMEKMLQKNIAPLQNSMQSWGTSNRWGPSLSFDINVLVQRGINAIITPEFSRVTPKEKADKNVAQQKQQAENKKDVNEDQAQPTTVDTVQFGLIHSRYQFSQEEKKAKNSDALKFYNMTSEASAEQHTHAGLVNKLRELKDSFKRIQDKYVQLSIAATFHQKPECSF